MLGYSGPLMVSLTLAMITHYGNSFNTLENKQSIYLGQIICGTKQRGEKRDRTGKTSIPTCRFTFCKTRKIGGETSMLELTKNVKNSTFRPWF